MSMGVVVYLPTCAASPVQNPPMRKGPKPKGTLSFHAARQRYKREERARKDDDDDVWPSGVSDVVARQAKLLAEAFAELGLGERWRVISLAQDLAGKNA